MQSDSMSEIPGRPEQALRQGMQRTWMAAIWLMMRMGSNPGA